MIEPLKKGEFRESVIADKINEMVEKINEIHKAIFDAPELERPQNVE